MTTPTLNLHSCFENEIRINQSRNSALSLQEIQSTSEYAKLLNILKNKEKTELHAHLGGAISTSFINSCCNTQDYDLLLEFISNLRSGMDYTKAFEAFNMIGRILNSNQRIEEAAFDFCQNQYNDKVTFSEIRTGLKRLDGKGFEEYLTAVLRGLNRGMQEYPIHVNLILSLRRNSTIEDANETIDLAIKYRDMGITGIDISGESTKGDGSGIFEALQKAKNNGFSITLHIGENCNENPEQQMKELTQIQPERIGHAVFLCPEAYQWIEEKQIVVEACIRSALSVSMINNPGDHPAFTLFKKGHPVVFCTDDSTLFGTLSEELALVAYLCNLTIENVIEMQKKALEYSFK